MYGRQFATMVGMVLLSFLMLGASFATLSYQYTIRDKKDTLERNAKYIAEFTSVAIRTAPQGSGSLVWQTSAFQNYLNSRDAKVILQPIAEVRTEWESPLEMFRETLAHEQKVTAMIHNLASIAAADKDYASSNMLVWFVDEQVEEEENARDMIGACEALEGNKYGMYQFNKELAARVYTPATPLAASAE